MLQMDNLGATAEVWDISTSQCGSSDARCVQYGAEYVCHACTQPNKDLIYQFQVHLLRLIQGYGLASSFVGDCALSADKIVGWRTCRALGIVGAEAISRGHLPGSSVQQVIAACKAIPADCSSASSKSGTPDATKRLVTSHIPALLQYLADADTSKVSVPTPPMPGTPGHPIGPPVGYDLPRFSAAGLVAAGLVFGTFGLIIGASQ